MERHVPIGIFLLVALVGIATIMLSVSYHPGAVPFAVQYVPYGQAVAQQPGQNTVVINLEVGEAIASEIEGLSGDLLPALQGGRIQAKEISTDYRQALMFTEPGVFTGGRLAFGEDEAGNVGDFLEFPDAIFKLQMEFSPGLRSNTDDGRMRDIEEESFNILGDRFTIVDTDVNTDADRVSIRLFGGYGSVEFEDVYSDDAFSQGVQVNGQTIDALVKIRATESGDELTIYSIQYILNANARRGGEVQVLPLHCTREYLQYPTGLLVPNFDICYKGLESGVAPAEPQYGISGNEVRIDARGDDETVMIATNFIGQTYEIPLVQQPGMYGKNGRDFIFVEAANPGAPNINLGDYFLVMSKEKNGVSNVLRYDSIADNVVIFEDLATGNQRKATFNQNTGEGQLLLSEGTYEFVVGAGDALAMDQTNDNSISGDEAKWVFPGGTIFDFGPGFTMRVITPRRLFDDFNADEITEFSFIFNNAIDIDLPSPQAPIFDLESVGGGVRQGLTKYGILFTWERNSGDSDELDLVIPGAYARSVKGGAGAEVFVTFEREKLMKQPQAPAPAPVCGDKVITGGEVCDPPGSLCADEYFGKAGTCADDCSSCLLPTCGNKYLEPGEQCEAHADCQEGFMCQSCGCVKMPEPVCGNNLIERGEQCEADVDCGRGMVCNGCQCAPAPAPPVVETPTPPPRQPNIFARFFTWLASLFGA